MKKQIKEKVPKLTEKTFEFQDEINKPEYLDINSNIELMIEKMEANELECQELVKKMKNIRDYQETLDMKVDHFEKVENVY